MKPQRKAIRDDSSPPWERPEPAARAAPSPLSRNRIIAAAIGIADRDGLSAVSLRSVGAALDAGAMRLYGYLSTKEELLDLMIDAAYGEIVADGPLRGDWRKVLRTVARRTRQVCQAHPWLVDLLGGRPHMGPNALAHYEACLHALSKAPGFERIDTSVAALRALNAYVIGAIRYERAEAGYRNSKADWQKIWWPYLQRQIATGRFPMLAKVVRDATHPAPEEVFSEGLETVLDGLAAGL